MMTMLFPPLFVFIYLPLTRDAGSSGGGGGRKEDHKAREKSFVGAAFSEITEITEIIRPD